MPLWGLGRFVNCGCDGVVEGVFWDVTSKIFWESGEGRGFRWGFGESRLKFKLYSSLSSGWPLEYPSRDWALHDCAFHNGFSLE